MILWWSLTWASCCRIISWSLAAALSSSCWRWRNRSALAASDSFCCKDWDRWGSSWKNPPQNIPWIPFSITMQIKVSYSFIKKKLVKLAWNHLKITFPWSYYTKHEDCFFTGIIPIISTLSVEKGQSLYRDQWYNVFLITKCQGTEIFLHFNCNSLYLSSLHVIN